MKANNIIDRINIFEKQAKEYGLYWSNTQGIINQIISESQEVEELLAEQNIPSERLQEEIGDLMHAAFALCINRGFDPEQTLVKAMNKIEKRHFAAKSLAINEGFQTLHGQSLEKIMSYWNKAKGLVG